MSKFSYICVKTLCHTSGIFTCYVALICVVQGYLIIFMADWLCSFSAQMIDHPNLCLVCSVALLAVDGGCAAKKLACLRHAGLSTCLTQHHLCQLQ